jgi:hypothetical protein
MARLIVLLALFLAPQQGEFWGQNSPTGLVGWWKLSEGSGTTAYDSSGNGNNAVWSGGQIGTSGYYSAGHVGPWAGAFDGTSTKLLATVAGTYTQFTLSEWIYSTGTSGFIDAAKLGSTTLAAVNSGTSFRVVDGNYAANPSAFGSTTNSYWLNVWHHFVVSEDSTNVYVYVDGMLSATGTRSVVNGSVTNPTLQIGLIFTGRDLSGYANDIRLYNRALSAGEIAGLARNHN